MGLFSNTCNALVDKTTGRALTGEALLAAQADPNWPTCGNKVSKRAKFCNKCGKGAPKGWWRCPHCKKWVRNDSHFCPRCSAPLFPDERLDIAGGVWNKQPDMFAERFEVNETKKLLDKGLKIQEGTAAILLEAGAVSKILEAGRHKADGLLRSINWFGNPPPRSFILIDIGQIVIPLRLDELRTSEHIPVDFYGELVFRFKGDKEAAKDFCANFLKGERSISLEKITARAEPLVRGVVDEICVTSTIEDLVKDPERRIRLQERLEKRLAEDFASCGLEIVRVSSAEFSGEQYEALEAQMGEAEVKRREAEYHAALEATMRKIQGQAEKDSAKAAFDLREYKEMLDQEYRISADTREREYANLKREWQHDNIVHERLLEMEALEHSIDYDKKYSTYEREKKIEEARADAAVQSIRTGQDVKDTEAWLKVREQKLEIKQKDKAADASRRKNMSITEMILDAEDAETKKALLEALRIERNAGMTPEQLLAQLGKESTNDKLVGKLEELYKYASEREDRNLSKMLEPAIEAARHPTQSTGPIIK